MENKKRVLIGMSGGVDSSVSAILLKEQGYDVVGITMSLWNSEKDKGSCCNKEIEDAKKICEYLNIPHYTENLEKDFKKHVIDDFICNYSNCRTPNPCIECNKYLKFGKMYEKAKELKCDYIATGHYAKVEFDENYGEYVLKKSDSEHKDQSYVLYSIQKEIIEKLLFPLSKFKNKEDIRNVAREHGLSIANKPDSEDICFIPDGDYKSFLEKNSDISTKSGNIVDKKGKILGEHNGLYKYTIGQRKGLGISNPVPLFVLGFNKEKNQVIVGEKEELYSNEIYVNEANFLLSNIEFPIKVKTKIRYAAKEAKSTIYKLENGVYKILFEEPQRGATPGQSAVFYIEDIVLGGGKIIEKN